MFEEERTEGMSGFAAYSLGRMAAESDRITVEAALAFRRRLQPPEPTIDVNALLAENEMLRQQLEATQRTLDNTLGNYKALRDWSVDASAALREAGLIRK